MHFFRYDNPIGQLLIKFCNIVFLSILWYIFCLPVFTTGAATAAFYYTVQKNIKNDRGYVLSDFWSSFKENFKQGTILTLILLAVEFVFLSDYAILKNFQTAGNRIGNMYVLIVIIMVVIFIYILWTFIYISRFENTLVNVMKNSFILMFRHIGCTLYIVFMILFAYFASTTLPVSAFIMPAVAAWLISFPVERVFKRYLPEEDTGTQTSDPDRWFQPDEEVKADAAKHDAESTESE